MFATEQAVGVPVATPLICCQYVFPNWKVFWVIASVSAAMNFLIDKFIRGRKGMDVMLLIIFY